MCLEIHSQSYNIILKNKIFFIKKICINVYFYIITYNIITYYNTYHN